MAWPLVPLVVGLAACTPSELEMARQLGITPEALATAQASVKAAVAGQRPLPAPLVPIGEPTPGPLPAPVKASPIDEPAPSPLPPPPTTTTTTTTPPPAPPAPRPVLIPSEEDLYALRLCESSNNYAAVSPGGWYRGAYQFDRSTWNGVASRWYPQLVGVDPASASRAEQDAMARALWRERGWQPWPECGIGL